MLTHRTLLQILFTTALSAFCIQYFVFAPPPSLSGPNSASAEFNLTKYSSRKMASQKLRVLLLGGTGAIGQDVIKLLATEEKVQQTTLLLRREVDLSKYMDKEQQSKFSQKIINFDELNGDDFKDFDVCISTLGTTRGKSGPEGFYKVDHDYVVNTAKLAKDGNCKHFNLVTSGGANKNSFALYLKTKGQVEEEISNMGFPRTSIYRPGLLLTSTPRPETRAVEAVMQFMTKYFDLFRLVSIETSVVAKAIVRNSVRSSDSPLEVLSNRDMLNIGKNKN